MPEATKVALAGDHDVAAGHRWRSVNVVLLRCDLIDDPYMGGADLIHTYMEHGRTRASPLSIRRPGTTYTNSSRAVFYSALLRPQLHIGGSGFHCSCSVQVQ